MLNMDYVSSKGVDATCVGSAAGVGTEAGCDGWWCVQEMGAFTGLQAEQELGFIPGSTSSRQ